MGLREWTRRPRRYRGERVAETVDLLVVGGGIVGLAVARAALARFPSARLVLLEKERALARHQSGHSSGVVHAGVYYRPGSAKARLCVRGREELLLYARERGIPHRIIGKLIVATRPRDLPNLDELERRARANGVEGVRRVGPAEITEIEPEVRGVSALHVPSSAIIDFPAVARTLASDVRGAGGEIVLGSKVTAIRDRGHRLEVDAGATGRSYLARHLINCAGLYSDEVARAAGAPLSDRIIPFRGEFHQFSPARAKLVHSLVYPVPDPRLPFVDVHLTPTVDGRLLAGPNAVLAFAREGYRWRDVRIRELAMALAYPGFWRMLRRVPDAVVGELYRSLSAQAIARDLERMVPSIDPSDLLPAEAGVRAQVVAPDGSLREDFLFTTTPKALHVVNAPSPAASACLAIAEEIVSRLPPLEAR